jgi:hypothetical protein
MDSKNNVFNASAWENRKKAEERKKELTKKLLARKPMVAPVSPANGHIDVIIVQKLEPTAPSPIFSLPKAGAASIPFYTRDEPRQSLGMEPWTKALVDQMLEASTTSSIHLCLIWPGRLESVSLCAALASTERFATRDLMGMRTIVYPSKQATFLPLNSFLLDRDSLLRLTQTMYVSPDDAHTGNTSLRVARECDGKAELLMALGTIKKLNNDAPSPTIAELAPHFFYEPVTHQWGDYSERFFARSIKQLVNRGHQRDLRQKVKSTLGSPATAPDAMFGISHSIKKEDWEQALKSSVFKKNKPEMFLINATKDMQTTNFRAIQKISAFLKTAHDLHPQAGIVIVTDEPVTYFSLKKQLPEQLFRKIEQKVILAESGSGLSANPHLVGWTPKVRSLKHFPVHILDRQATGVVLRFLNIAHDLTGGSKEERACKEAGHFILQACQMPGGLRDLTLWMDNADLDDYQMGRMTWPHYEVILQNLLRQGSFGALAQDVRVAIEKAINLVNQWTVATPMALRLGAEIERHILREKSGLTVVFPRKYYADVAKNYLSRTFAGTNLPFESMAPYLTFTTQKELAAVQAIAEDMPQMIFVGLDDSSFRRLITSESIQAGSTVLLSYKQASDYAIALKSLAVLDELKPYRPRIAPLLKEIELKISQVENPLSVSRLQMIPTVLVMDIPYSPEVASDTENDNDHWRLILEDAGTVIVGKRVYRYDPDTNPTFAIVDVGQVQINDSIFVMTDELRESIEALLTAHGYPVLGRGLTKATALKQYQSMVSQQVKTLFPQKTMVARVEAIKQRMLDIDPALPGPSGNRIHYWLDVDDASGDTAPHAARDLRTFRVFLKALGIPDHLTDIFWQMAVLKTRTGNQLAGRLMSDFHSHILFQQESLQIYENIKPADIQRLQRESLKALFRVIGVKPPLHTRTS